MADFVEATQSINDELACSGCGALLKFKPGTLHLVCEYCGAENEIDVPKTYGKFDEISLEDFLANNFNEEPKVEMAVVRCESCGATTTLDSRISSDQCPFCAASLVVKSGTTATLHKPQYVLPFRIEEKDAIGCFSKWIRSLWFAPGDLRKYTETAHRFSGMYLPFWTFDCSTTTVYKGERGVNHRDTETYTTTENGREVTRTRDVTRVEWYPASGQVSNAFDDVLIEATTSLRKEKLRALEPWDLRNLAVYNDKFLSGFRTETYAIDVRAGYQEAKLVMQTHIRETIRKDIGGDDQRITSTRTTYHNPTFKHILLPVWVSAYRYNNKVYQFIINARTGEVQGDRPYSAIKIALAVIAVIIIVGIIFVMNQD